MPPRRPPTPPPWPPPSPPTRIYIPLAELIDVEAEIKRVEKELAAGKTNLERLTAKLNNQGFVSKAPEQVVAAEREKAEKQASVIAKLEETLKTLRQMA